MFWREKKKKKGGKKKFLKLIDINQTSSALHIKPNNQAEFALADVTYKPYELIIIFYQDKIEIDRLIISLANYDHDNLYCLHNQDSIYISIMPVGITKLITIANKATVVPRALSKHISIALPEIHLALIGVAKKQDIHKQLISVLDVKKNQDTTSSFKASLGLNSLKKKNQKKKKKKKIQHVNV